MDELCAYDIGDIIKFNFQGRSYMLLGSVTTVAGQAPTLPLAGQLLSTSFPSTACNLWCTDGSELYRKPATPTAGVSRFRSSASPSKSAVPPLQLPDGCVVDVANSGVGLTGLFSRTTPYLNPTVTFGPTGAVEFVYDGSTILHPATTIFFLIGRRDGMLDVNTNTNSFTPNPQNPFDLTNLWVSISPNSGRVVTSENANATTFGNARAFAQSTQTMGGQ